MISKNKIMISNHGNDKPLFVLIENQRKVRISKKLLIYLIVTSEIAKLLSKHCCKFVEN